MPRSKRSIWALAVGLTLVVGSVILVIRSRQHGLPRSGPGRAFSAWDGLTADEQTRHLVESWRSEATPGNALLLLTIVQAKDDTPVERATVVSLPSATSEPGLWFASDPGLRLAQGIGGDRSHAPLTDQQGRAWLDLEPGQATKWIVYTIDDSLEGEVIDVGPMMPGEVWQLRVALAVPPPVEYWGRLVSAGAHEPIQGATIRVSSRTWLQGIGTEIVDGPHTTTLAIWHSDQEGLFRLEYPSSPEADVKIEAPGWGCRLLQVWKGHEVASRAQRIELMRDSAVRLVLQNERGEPMPGVAAELSAHAGALLLREFASSYECTASDLSWTATSDASGACDFAGLPPRVSLRASCVLGSAPDSQKREAITLDPGENRTVRWTWSN